MAKNLAGLGLVMTLTSETVQAADLMVDANLESQIQTVAEEAIMAGSEVESRVQAFVEEQLGKSAGKRIHKKAKKHV